jgi:CHAT domain-containing protein
VPFAIPPPALDEVRALYRELTQADRVAHGLHAEREVSVDAIIGALPEDGALLEVFPTRDWLYAFVISRGSVRCTRVERTETFDDALETAVRDLRLGSTVGIWHERRLRGALRRLHAGLLGDTATSLDGVSRLWISPGAELMGVPWPALIGQDGASLVDRFELTMLLSGAQLALPRPARERSRLALVRGNDGPRPLSAADLEVDEIARMFAAQGWAVDRCGPETARSGIDEAIQRASVFHFSGHAGFCEAEGMAALLATPERPLVAAEILGLDLRAARLAVLSACETGRGEAHTGDELVGLLRAFFAAGCQAVLASRWLADDATTTFVMLATYERWLAGERLAEALREAQRQLRAIVPDQPLHPFFWANFALYGVE